MRIGIDFRPALFTRTGVGRYVRELVRAEQALGREDLELALYADSWRPPVDVETLAIARASRTTLARARIPGRLFQLLGRAGFGVENRIGRIDLFHHTDLVFPPVRCAPQVVTLHDLAFEIDESFHAPEFGRAIRARMRAALPRVRAVITPSEETRRRVLERYGLPLERVACIPHAVDHMLEPLDAAGDDEVDRLLERHRVRRPFVLAVGTIEPRKNHRRLLAAFELFGKKHPHQLVVVGRYGWLCEDVRERLKELAAGERVAHLDDVPDRFLPGLYDRAEIHAYPSLYEGFGLPALESMARGTPTITTRGGALGEVGGDAVFYVDGRSVDEIAEALAILADDPARRERLGRAGRLRAERFRWKDSARAHVELYRRVMDGESPRVT